MTDYDYSLNDKIVQFFAPNGSGVITGKGQGSICVREDGRKRILVLTSVERSFREAFEDWGDHRWGMECSHLFEYLVDPDDIIKTLDENNPDDQPFIRHVEKELADLLKKFQKINFRKELSQH